MRLKYIFFQTAFYVFIGLFFVIFIFCGFFLYKNLKEKSEFDSNMNEIKELMELQEFGTTNPEYQEYEYESESGFGLALQGITPEDGETTSFLADTAGAEENTALVSKTAVNYNYSALKALNPDFVGRVTIFDTVLDYPVMQTKSDPFFYLYRDFYKADSKYGLPFAAAECDLENPADNILIHGHHMKDGSIFGTLINYQSADYRSKHPVIRFETLDESHEFTIFAVFKTSAEDGFDFYNYINLGDETNFSKYVNTVKALSFYETDINPEFGTRLLTLATCEYTLTDGRLVVVARENGINE